VKKIIIFLIAISIVFPFGGFSREVEDFILYGGEPEDFILYVGESRNVSGYSIQRIAISRPEVLDVIKVTENEITLTGKSKGESMLVWWDKLGEHTLRVKVYFEDMIGTKERVDRLLKEMDASGVYTKAIDSEGKVFLFGQVKKQEDLERISFALSELGGKITNLIRLKESDAIVEISVQILELQKGEDKNLGFTLPDSITFSETTAPTSIPFNRIFPISLWDRTKFATTLNFLISEGKARVLSRPQLVCRSGKEAELFVGGEVPILTTKASGSTEITGTAVEYKEYGIKLNVRPVVTDMGMIDLILSVEVSEIGAAETLGSEAAPTAKAYPISKRNIITELSLKDNEVLSIGGLIKQKTEEDLKKFPWLADIPILGTFFRSKTFSKGGGSTSKGDTELFITLSPKIIFRDKSPGLAEKLPAAAQSRDPFKHYKETEIPAGLENYVGKVKKMIWENISYPQLAVGTGWNGSLLISLKISCDGKLMATRVVKPSEYKIFDDETLKTVKRLFYPPFPPLSGLKELDLKIPVIYGSGK